MAGGGLEQYAVPWWVLDNPQARGAAAFNPEPVVAPLELWLVPDSTPEPDPQVQYPGQGAKALWDDVWHYGKSILSYFGRSGGGLAYVTTDMLNSAVDDVLKANISALSGYINQATQLAVDAQNWASRELNALDANIGAIYQYFDDHIKFLEQAVVQLAQADVPFLSAEINALRHDMLAGFAFNSAADRAWATDHIFRPLQEDIFREALRANAAIDDSAAKLKSYVDDQVGNLGIRTLGALGAVQLAVKALQTFQDECAVPMCETMGPKTDLGKLLKGLKLALAAGVLAEIANANEGDVADAITRIANHLATVIGTFETSFVQGGSTTAGLVADELKNLI